MLSTLIGTAKKATEVENESSEAITTEGLLVLAIKRGLCIADFHEISIGMILEYIRRYDKMSKSIDVFNTTIANATRRYF